MNDTSIRTASMTLGSTGRSGNLRFVVASVPFVVHYNPPLAGTVGLLLDNKRESRGLALLADDGEQENHSDGSRHVGAHAD